MGKFTGRSILACLAGIGLLAAASFASAAIQNVRCIPWQGDTAKYHTAISGQSVKLKAVINTTDTNAIWYKWVFGDGAESAVLSLSGATQYKTDIDHTYVGVSETPFTAQLQVSSVDSSLANRVTDPYYVQLQDDALDARVNIAIDKGLWWLYTNNTSNSNMHTFDGSPFMVWSYSTYYASPTASAVQAFSINNHKTKGNAAEDPYVEAVQLGMNWLIKGYYANSSYPMLQSVSIASFTAGFDPEDGQATPNRLGIEARDYSYNPVYETGQVMDAIIASGVAPGDDTGRDFSGRGSNWTYGELIQDLVDMYAWGQIDSGYYLGGWRYGWNYANSDNSACQWASIGIIPALQAPWNATVPVWVKTQNATWLNTSYATDGIYGGFGYTSPSYGYGTSPSGLVQMDFVGQIGYDDPATPADERDAKWVRTELWLATNWNSFLSYGSGRYIYNFYAFAKAMRLSKPQPIERLVSNNLDWYNGSGGIKGLAQHLVETQASTGYWNGGWASGALPTAWSVIILNPALFEPGPSACFTANPNPSYANYDIIFDPTCSDHAATGKDINNLTKFEWDWNNDGVWDTSTASPVDAVHAFACASIPCTYPVTLRVTDDNAEPISATFTLNVNITNPPHPPVADANGPYMVSLCQNDSLTLDGSGSFDPDQGQHEAGCPNCPDDKITAWDWDLTTPLTGFDDKSGESVVVDAGSYFTAGNHNVGLRVTDNTAASYPTSGEENFTDTDFSTVSVTAGCLCDLDARAKSGKVQLTWSHTGAASYDVYRSTTGPNSGFSLIADNIVTTYATYLDGSVVNGTAYWYRVVSSDGCGSQGVKIIPTAARTR